MKQSIYHKYSFAESLLIIVGITVNTDTGQFYIVCFCLQMLTGFSPKNLNFGLEPLEYIYPRVYGSQIEPPYYGRFE